MEHNIEDGLTSVEREVVSLKRRHKQTWQDKQDWFWLLGLLEEVWELCLSLVKLYRHAPEVELAQIAAICVNWLEKRKRNSLV